MGLIGSMGPDFRSMSPILSQCPDAHRLPPLLALTELTALQLVARVKSRFRRTRLAREAGRESKHDWSGTALDLPLHSLHLRSVYRARRTVVGQVGAPCHGPRLR